MRRPRAGACRGRRIAPPRTPPNTPPALNRCDEAAEVKNMLYSSYGQKGGCIGYMDNLLGLPTYPMRPPHLPTAAIYDLNDSPPNSLFKKYLLNSQTAAG